jgi:hypothetical protein
MGPFWGTFFFHGGANSVKSFTYWGGAGGGGLYLSAGSGDMEPVCGALLSLGTQLPIKSTDIQRNSCSIVKICAFFSLRPYGGGFFRRLHVHGTCMGAFHFSYELFRTEVFVGNC